MHLLEEWRADRETETDAKAAPNRCKVDSWMEVVREAREAQASDVHLPMTTVTVPAGCGDPEEDPRLKPVHQMVRDRS